MYLRHDVSWRESDRVDRHCNSDMMYYGENQTELTDIVIPDMMYHGENQTELTDIVIPDMMYHGENQTELIDIVSQT